MCQKVPLHDSVATDPSQSSQTQLLMRNFQHWCRLQSLHKAVDDGIEAARAEASRRQTALLTARDIIHAEPKETDGGLVSTADSETAAQKVAAVATHAARELLDTEANPDLQLGSA